VEVTQEIKMLKKYNRKVPEFEQYYPTMDDMDESQRQFYECWLVEWRKGKALDVEGNITYLFCYLYTVLDPQDPKKTLHELNRIVDSYSFEEKFCSYCKGWIIDCYLLLQDYRKALDLLLINREREEGKVFSNYNLLLTLKLHFKEKIDGKEIVNLYGISGTNLTSWGRKNLDAIESYLNTIVSAHEKYHNINLLEEWAKSSHKYNYQAFPGSPCLDHGNPILINYAFTHTREAMDFVYEITREAENTAREERGIPRIGEGWVEETTLYYEIKNAFKQLEVIHHARPEWLGRQHLDIMIPQLNVAIEYHGIQHDEPIEFFGGKEAFEKQQRLDAKKELLCKENGIYLLYVRPGYSLEEIIKQIKERRAIKDEQGDDQQGKRIP
jgi:hypothetical protein